MKSIALNLISFTEFIQFIEVIIWPLTLILALIFFRKNLSGILSSLGSVKAGPTGFEMTFQEQLNSVTNLIDRSTDGTSKSAAKISVGAEDNLSPFEQLHHLRDQLNAKILTKAAANTISVEGKSIKSILADLKDTGLITIHNYRRLTSFSDLTLAAHKGIGQSEVDQVKKLYKKLEI